MAFLVFAFLPGQRDLTAGFKSLVKPKTGFFLFWLLFFVISHLWNFRTAPWNGNGLFEDSAVDLLVLEDLRDGSSFSVGLVSSVSFPHFAGDQLFTTTCGPSSICLAITLYLMRQLCSSSGQECLSSHSC